MNTRALQICRGLNLKEVGWLASALGSPGPDALLPHLSGHQDAPPAVALQRGLHTDTTGLGAAITARLSQSASASLAIHHPEWRTMSASREPKRVTKAMFNTDKTQPPGLSARWLLHHAAQRFGWLDPRHIWEHQQGVVLEFGQLALLGEPDLGLLLCSLGLEIMATAMQGASLREIAAAGHRLGPHRATVLLARAREPRLHHRGTRHLTRHAMLTLKGANFHTPDTRLRALGLCGLALAAGTRRHEEVRTIACSMNLEEGEWLLWCLSQAPRGSSTRRLSDDFASLALDLLQALSREGRTQSAHHHKTPLLAPPDAYLSDEPREEPV